MKTFLIINFIWLLATANSLAQCYFQDAVPSPYDYHAVIYKSVDTIYILGSNGFITYNGVSNEWNTEIIHSPAVLLSLEYLKPCVLLAVGENGVIMRSEDCGNTWSKKNSGTIETLKCVSFSDTCNGWAVGENGTIIKTPDGGQVWIPQVSNTTSGLTSIHMIDELHGWIVGDGGYISSTINGGITWEVTSGITTKHLFCVYFYDELHGWITGKDKTLLRTEDGGASWQALNNLPGIDWMTSMFFVDDETGWTAGYAGSLYHTTDRGTSWIVQNTPPPLPTGVFYNLCSIFFIDELTGFSVGSKNTVIYTENGGNDWEMLSSGNMNSFYSIALLDSLNGCCGGINNVVLTTDDGGATWTQQNLGNFGIVDMCVPTNTENLWSCKNNKVAISYDKGINWYITTLASGYVEFSSIYFPSAGKGWVAGTDIYTDSGVIYRTTNGGTSWTGQLTANVPLNSVFFINDDTGWSVGFNGRIYKTENSGINWIQKPSPTAEELLSVDFINSEKGWIAGSEGTLLSTDDGGDSWSVYNLGINNMLNFVKFFDEIYGVVGGTGYLAYTIDSGNSWINDNTGTGLFLEDMYTLGLDQNWIAGIPGVLLAGNLTERKVKLGLDVLLEGPYVNGEMSTYLIGLSGFPLVQPYSVSPWNYIGNESIQQNPNSAIVDWILFELREADSVESATPATMILRRALLVNKYGHLVDPDGYSDPEFTVSIAGNYFAVIYHRNHLPVISADPLALTGSVYQYSFVQDSTSAYGGTTALKKMGPDRWGMIAGDGNADGQIDNSDKIMVWREQSGLSGYLSGDFNLDTYVNNPDKIDIWNPNAGMSSQIPD